MSTVTTNKAPKLTSVKQIRTQLIKAETMRRNVTISALYHALVKSNVAWMDNWSRTDAAMLDATLRVLCPTKWVKPDASKGIKGHYKRDTKKADEIMGKLGVNREMTYPEFYPILEQYWLENSEKKKSEELTLDQKQGKLKGQMARLLGQWAEAGLSYGEVETMLKRARDGKDILPKAK
ncbi:hypothetical protein OY1_02 [Vibrio phage OY1]|nr:hypothetical protein OY1_02 [Vibrio phage OY1]